MKRPWLYPLIIVALGIVAGVIALPRFPTESQCLASEGRLDAAGKHCVRGTHSVLLRREYLEGVGIALVGFLGIYVIQLAMGATERRR